MDNRDSYFGKRVEFRCYRYVCDENEGETSAGAELNVLEDKEFNEKISEATKNVPELPIGRFLNSKSLGGNRVILVVTRRE